MGGPCKTCTYFRAGHQHPNHTEQRDGICIRYPPQVINVAVTEGPFAGRAQQDTALFPRVTKDTGCGEYLKENVNV